MTLDEAIAYAYKVAVEQSGIATELLLSGTDASEYLERKREHEQLAEWLEELKEYREIGTPEECRAAVEKTKEKEPIIDKCTCPSCGTYNEVVKERRNTVVRDTVYCWHCGQALSCKRDIDI